MSIVSTHTHQIHATHTLANSVCLQLFLLLFLLYDVWQPVLRLITAICYNKVRA